MIEALKQPPAPEAEPPDEEYPCQYEGCPVVLTGPDAWYELGAHEVEHLEDC